MLLIPTPFNSTLVRLEELSFTRCKPPATFNSTLVRLEAVNANHFATVQTFQFHTGSIRSATKRRDRAPAQHFQFHTGSIRSGARCFPSNAHILPFNSTLVRLEDRLRCRVGFRVAFNSTLVRLEEFHIAQQQRAVFDFQFHTGSIRRKPVRFGALHFGYLSIPHWFD